jgi:preprotein translocase subunit SecE
MKNIVKIHHTHKQRMRSLFRQGFSEEEISRMYKIEWPSVKEIVKGIEKPERI